MAKKRIALNGFGRIGRCAARILLKDHSDKLELVAINDPSDAPLCAHLFEFDSNYGRYDGKVSLEEGGKILNVDGHKIQKFETREIKELPWGKLGIDVVLECTGAFCNKEKAGPHITQGAKKVLLSAPPKDDSFVTIVPGVNDQMLKSTDQFVSCASCTTNGLAPIVKVLHENFGIISGIMTTIHAYTNDQNILDVGHKDWRRARAAALNMIPTSTGAAKAIGCVLPELKGKLDGLAIRVPTPTVSLVDLTIRVEKKATVESINAAVAAAAKKIPHIIGYEPRPLVSSDFKGDTHSTIFDPSETKVIGDLVKILTWYDNEWGYSCRFVELAERM